MTIPSDLKPVTCGCGNRLARFDSATGCIRLEGLDTELEVFGIYLSCDKCGRRMKFDGLRIRKKMRKNLSRHD